MSDETFAAEILAQCAPTIERLKAERDMALRAEEDAVELVFELQHAMGKINALANQAAAIATSHNERLAITEIATLAQKFMTSFTG